ncbi:hypothetical protein INT48_008566 [Thamnidium elegans]|uniref:Uncharacterized protein n=1 Tax=Thamnidium elegans TaxID=101142 RepID=A0A8H7SST2_9FUNG|nr:hypothetical protein INT48_008566 [Thamnidium elegans]
MKKGMRTGFPSNAHSIGLLQKAKKNTKQKETYERQVKNLREEEPVNKNRLQAVRPQKLAHRKTQAEVFQEVLGSNYDRYTRKIKLDTILRENYKAKFNDCLIKLNEFLRESFWYSVRQLIMKIAVSNKDNLSLSFVKVFSEFSEMCPSIFCPLKGRKITGYSDPLTYACVTLATTYLNLMVETFEHTIETIFEDGN